MLVIPYEPAKRQYQQPVFAKKHRAAVPLPSTKRKEQHPLAQAALQMIVVALDLTCRSND